MTRRITAAEAREIKDTLGALEYITKPVDVRGVLKSVDDVLDHLLPEDWREDYSDDEELLR